MPLSVSPHESQWHAPIWRITNKDSSLVLDLCDLTCPDQKGAASKAVHRASERQTGQPDWLACFALLFKVS